MFNIPSRNEYKNEYEDEGGPCKSNGQFRGQGRVKDCRGSNIVDLVVVSVMVIWSALNRGCCEDLAGSTTDNVTEILAQTAKAELETLVLSLLDIIETQCP